MQDLMRVIRESRTADELMAWVEACVPEVAVLKGSSGRLEFHPEGNSWVHMTLVMAQAFDQRVSDAAKVAALFHDLGKAVSAGLSPNPITGRTAPSAAYTERGSHLQHDEFSARMVGRVLAKYVDLSQEPELLSLCEDIGRYHIRCHSVCDKQGVQLVSDEAVRNLLKSMGYWEWTEERKDDFFAALRCDHFGRAIPAGAERDAMEAQGYVPERILRNMPRQPVIAPLVYHNEFVRQCVANIKWLDPAYWQATLAQRTDPEAKAGSYYAMTGAELEAKVLESIHWQEFFPNSGAMPDCRYFRAPIAGFNGMAALKCRPNTTKVLLRDVKQTGFLSALIDGGPGDYVPEPATTLIAGQENGVWVVFTLHPGAPLEPSRIEPSDRAREGMILSAKQARRLGFEQAKFAELPELRQEQTMVARALP